MKGRRFYNVPVYPDKINSQLAEKRVYANKVSLLGRFACSYTEVLVLERLCVFHTLRAEALRSLGRSKGLCSQGTRFSAR